MAGNTSSEASSSTITSDANGGESKVVDCGRNKSSCGYCKSPGKTSVSHGLWAHSLTVYDYQDLLDRGWRRSGSFLYKPEMEKTCCPSYTIRLNAGHFVPSKEQLRVTRRLQRFLDGNLDCNRLPLKEDQQASKETQKSLDANVSTSVRNECLTSGNGEENNEETILQHLSDRINIMVRACVANGEFPSEIELPKAIVKKVTQGKRKLHVEGSQTLLYSSNISFQIMATFRKRAEPGGQDSRQLSPKDIAEKLVNSLNQFPENSRLSVKACNGHINFYSSAYQASLDGKSKTCSLESTHKASLVKKRRLEIHLKQSSFDPEEYDLYRRYQIKVHNDTPDHVTESSYKRFLVDSPLTFVPPTGDNTVPLCGFGSFHQQYVIDGQLVAVGVVDILPKCLSSKYLFWDPDFAFLSLGKYTALQEVNWVKENQIHCPNLQSYYLGYYIHSCNKMRYKATYRPSELLCPLRYQWVPFDVARPYLDRKRYVVLSDCALLQAGESLLQPDGAEQDDDLVLDSNDVGDVHMHQNEETADPIYDSSDDMSGEESSDSESAQAEEDISDVLIGLKGSSLRYNEVQQAFHPRQTKYLETLMRRYLRVVGSELSERMVYLLG